jgi:hypothetical protein
MRFEGAGGGLMATKVEDRAVLLYIAENDFIYR